MAGTKLYVVRLSQEERDELTLLVRTGRAAAYKRTHAQVLLGCDQGDFGPAWADAKVAEATGVSMRTVVYVRQRLVEQGLTAAVGRKAAPPPPRKLDGHGEAQLIAQACSAAPKGRVKWTMQLLADRLVELRVVDSISAECVRRTLKKTRSART